MSGQRRASSLSPPEFYLLTAWGRTICEAFGAMPYLVGSCGRGEVFRDVDVRMMLDGDDALWIVTQPGQEPMLAALNVAVSMWGQRATGLPIDFQFQDQEAANVEFGDERRNAVGIHRERHRPR